MTTLKEVREIYQAGKNVTQFLRERYGVTGNSKEIIEWAYDLQAGSYVDAMKDPEISAHKDKYAKEIAAQIERLCSPQSIMEAGVGEATTFAAVLKHLNMPVAAQGFDISWSRAAYARKWLDHNQLRNVRLCTAELQNIPVADSSVDVVYTSHSIEPNGGAEEEILRELYRVTRKYLVLLEPAYDMADDAAKERMRKLGYCTKIRETVGRLEWDVLAHELFPHSVNPMNPTALTIIRKRPEEVSAGEAWDGFVCPKFKVPLVEHHGDVLASRDSWLVYPVLGGIPCLRIGSGIVASSYTEMTIDKRFA